MVGAQVPAYLANGFYKRQRFNIAHGASNFGDDKIVLARFAQQKDVAFYFIGDVRHYLHSFAEVFALAFFGDDIIIDAPGGHIVGLRSAHIKETLVMPKVQIGLCPVIGDIALAMFVGVERARVDVDVRVKLLNGDRKPTGLKEFAQRSRDDALAQRRGNATGNEDVFCRRHEVPKKFGGKGRLFDYLTIRSP